MVLQYIRKHGQITRRDVIELCRIGPFQATRLLKKLVKAGDLQLKGNGRGSYYEITKKNKCAKKALLSGTTLNSPIGEVIEELDLPETTLVRFEDSYMKLRRKVQPKRVRSTLFTVV